MIIIPTTETTRWTTRTTSEWSTDRVAVVRSTSTISSLNARQARPRLAAIATIVWTTFTEARGAATSTIFPVAKYRAPILGIAVHLWWLAHCWGDHNRRYGERISRNKYWHCAIPPYLPLLALKSTLHIMVPPKHRPLAHFFFSATIDDLKLSYLVHV